MSCHHQYGLTDLLTYSLTHGTSQTTLLTTNLTLLREGSRQTKSNQTKSINNIFQIESTRYITIQYSDNRPIRRTKVVQCNTLSVQYAYLVRSNNDTTVSTTYYYYYYHTIHLFSLPPVQLCASSFTHSLTHLHTQSIKQSIKHTLTRNNPYCMMYIYITIN